MEGQVDLDITVQKQDAEKSIHERSAALDRARLAVKTKQKSLDAIIAQALSAKPKAVDWMAHPGLLTMDEVIALTGMTSKNVALLMERHRKARG